jgi:hypothetical protein
MGVLLGPDGNPIGSSLYKKAPAAHPDKAFGHWAGRSNGINYAMPGGSIIQFDLSRLTLGDFRQMRDHYQVNASLAVQTFMLHQLEWKITGGTAKSREYIQTNLEEVWNRLIRAMAQSFWAGYSPCVLEWENDTDNGRVKLGKIKDLIPEECRVHWKRIDGWAPPGNIPPKYYVYDGIRQYGLNFPIPKENTFWYPLLMENGDYYGRKLLRAAFPSYFFSILMHLFSNRYFERFGEPVPVGRASFGDTVEIDGKSLQGREAMELILTQLRNRSVVVLPNDRVQVSDNRYEYEWDIQYLESQMRGADFERYLERLDTEISISIFTPPNTLKGSEQGYNTTVGQMQMYLLLLNAIAGDMKEYIDRYIVDALRLMNFGKNHPKIEWTFRKLGKQNIETIKAIVGNLARVGGIKPDVNELGEILGLTLEEVAVVTAPPAAPGAPAPGAAAGGAGGDTRVRTRTDKARPKGSATPKQTGAKIAARLEEQVIKAFRTNTFGAGFAPQLGYRRQFEDDLVREGADRETAAELSNDLYERMASWMVDAQPIAADADDFMGMFRKLLDVEIDGLV